MILLIALTSRLELFGAVTYMGVSHGWVYRRKGDYNLNNSNKAYNNWLLRRKEGDNDGSDADEEGDKGDDVGRSLGEDEQFVCWVLHNWMTTHCVFVSVLGWTKRNKMWKNCYKTAVIIERHVKRELLFKLTKSSFSIGLFNGQYSKFDLERKFPLFFSACFWWIEWC